MNEDKNKLHFIIVLIVLFSVAGFVGLEVSKTMVDLNLIQGSFYNTVRHGEKRLLSEVNRDIQDIRLETIDEGFQEINESLNNL